MHQYGRKPKFVVVSLIGVSNSFSSADLWSVGCTVIEMAIGKPPWSQQYQEVAALFHIWMTKSQPPILDHLSVEAKDFLLKYLQKEPNFRVAAAVLLQTYALPWGWLKFARATVEHADTVGSDHSGGLLHLDPDETQLKALFWFDARWVQDEEMLGRLLSRSLGFLVCMRESRNAVVLLSTGRSGKDSIQNATSLS
ncbi:hypothetical protein Vadar_005991 [Vaccinium darrowii]|uniref:Uncharacterized protein n=1 Tax=Vaccinium darrowii TaxID=229202 RepID=A0ACB7ZHH6_9ERIC|nr:hypothetical protein Vadar_005991 [Vaccinium darrowii]